MTPPVSAQNPSAPRLAMVAGEASGDLLAAELLAGARAHWPAMRTQGIGGPAMAAEGFEAWWPYEKLAVRGYAEVLRHYPEIAGIRRRLRDRLLADKPDAFIGVDAPDFNLGLEAWLRKGGVKTIHFVCPSIWAWRANRVDRIRESCDHVLCIFPFEPALLAEHGIAATYVGHPLAPVIPRVPDRAGARQKLGLPDKGPVVALLPGSRAAEIEYIAPAFLEAAKILLRARPELRFVLPAIPSLKGRVDALAATAGLGDRLTVLAGQSHAALAACDITLIASGTATLEAALFKRPMVIAYRMNRLSWWMMRGRNLQPWVGLPNILCRESLVPELLQDDANPEALARAVLEWLDQPERIRQLEARFSRLHEDLSRDTATLATDAIQKVLEG